MIEDGKELIDRAKDGEVQWDDLTGALDQALDEIEELSNAKEALLEHIDDLYLRIDALEAKLERTRNERVWLAYQNAGPGR